MVGLYLSAIRTNGTQSWNSRGKHLQAGDFWGHHSDYHLNWSSTVMQRKSPIPSNYPFCKDTRRAQCQSLARLVLKIKSNPGGILIRGSFRCFCPWDRQSPACCMQVMVLLTMRRGWVGLQSLSYFRLCSAIILSFCGCRVVSTGLKLSPSYHKRQVVAL